MIDDLSIAYKSVVSAQDAAAVRRDNLCRRFNDLSKFLGKIWDDQGFEERTFKTEHCEFKITKSGLAASQEYLNRDLDDLEAQVMQVLVNQEKYYNDSYPE